MVKKILNFFESIASSIFTFLCNLGETVSDVSTWKSKRSNALFIII